MNFDEALALVEAGDLKALFGDDKTLAPRRYRRLARLLHPDHASRSEASDAFVKLSSLWTEFNGGSTSSAPSIITTRHRSFRVDAEAARGDIATLFHGVDLSTDEPVLLKMPRSPKDNDLMEAEAKALKILGNLDPFTAPDGSQAEPKCYFPWLVESFRHKDSGSGVVRMVNAIVPAPGFVSLQQVIEANGGPLHPKDAAWMWRRGLYALGLAHQAGFVHGAVAPSNVLILPDRHGLVLADWCYSVPADGSERIKAAVPSLYGKGYPPWYPPEVEAKEAATPATDIYMAGRLLAWMMQPRSSGEQRMFGAFVNGVCLKGQRGRPQDAWTLLDEFDDLIQEAWGPRRFRPFATTATPVVDPVPATA